EVFRRLLLALVQLDELWLEVLAGGRLDGLQRDVRHERAGAGGEIEFESHVVPPCCMTPVSSIRWISSDANPSSASIARLCSPIAGTAPMRGSKPSRLNGGLIAPIGPAGVSTSRQRSRARSCGCSQNCFIVFSCALAMPALSSASIAWGAVFFRNTFSISACMAARFAARAGLL